MFTSKERDTIRNQILEKAQGDFRLSGGAITGSFVLGNEDRWSDVDLAFGVIGQDKVEATLKDFTQFMYDNYDCYHHLDVLSGDWTYRVFFLNNTLQVDIAFVHDEQFRARAPSFKLVFGKSLEPHYNPPRQVDVLVGWAWLYALHVRTSLARQKYWQSEYYISGIRDYVISMMCLRHNLPTTEGRGVDSLPIDLRTSLEAGLMSSLHPAELRRAFEAIIEVFIVELGRTNKDLCERLSVGLRALIGDIRGLSGDSHVAK